MSDDSNSHWEVEPAENFLDDHFLYRGIHKSLWMQWDSIDTIQPNFFIMRHALNGLSVDWSKYAKPKDTLKHKRNGLTTYGVIQIKVERLRKCVKKNLFPLELYHNPIPENRAHSLIEGIPQCNKARLKVELSEIAEWAPKMKPYFK